VTEKTLSQKTVFEGCLLNVEVLQVSLPDGKSAVRELVHLPDAVCAAVITVEGQGVLVRQFRKAVESISLEVPAGRINRGEDPAAAVVRELEEEIGYRSGKVERLFDFWSSPGFCDERMTAYLVTEAVLGPSRLDEGEFLEVVMVPVLEMVEMAVSGRLADVKSLATVLAAARRLGI
jgi:ADP-ribose pyrophosphatase